MLDMRHGNTDNSRPDRVPKVDFDDRIRKERHLMQAGNLATEDKRPVIEMTRRLLSTPVPPACNRGVVAQA